ncbi:MAG: hypothetical protein ACPIOQ_81520, partial [Promethearchaeia archaeon]
STRAELAGKQPVGVKALVAAVAAAQSGTVSAVPLVALEMVLAVVQMLVNPSATALLLTTGLQTSDGCAHAGAWGMARVARAEVVRPVRCFGATRHTAPELVSPTAEPEITLRLGLRCVPRLMPHSPLTDHLVRLRFHARGAISNLFLEPLPTLAELPEPNVLLHVRAVGLNFRDVLNVLGEYPGDPGPPGGDCSGIVSRPSTITAAMFGIGHAPLACVAVAARVRLADKPEVLSFEEASTLPVTWSTTHMSILRAGLREGKAIMVQAAAGGVGLKAVEYAHWLLSSVVGTAGRPFKHHELRVAGVDALSSSRNSAAFAFGAMRLKCGERSH